MFLYLLGILMVYTNFTYSQIPNTFTTERLCAEKATNSHENYLSQIISNRQVQEVYYNNLDEASFNNIPAQLEIINNQWEKYGYGLYIIFNKETSEFIGFAGFHSTIIDENKTIDVLSDKNRDELEIYGLFMPNHWRKGYATEIGKELIKLAFEHLPHTSIISCIDPKNEASLGLIKKFDFKEENRVNYNNESHILYRLKKNN